jgi:hypothetical protein
MLHGDEKEADKCLRMELQKTEDKKHEILNNLGLMNKNEQRLKESALLCLKEPSEIVSNLFLKNEHVEIDEL